MLPVVYIDATIPSWYHEVRDDPESVAHRRQTQRWWDEHGSEYRVVASREVTRELEQGDYPTKEDCLAFARQFLFLPIGREVQEVAEAYVAHKLMPNSPDALHLAVASHHKCDFLLTLNYRHLANANKFAHMRRINTRLGLPTPTIVTPIQLTGA